jgi:hypothetical protein
MAYTDHGNTGNRDGHGWAIAGAFAGQAAIIISIGALLAGADTTATVTQVSAAGSTPVISMPQPAFKPAFGMPDIKGSPGFSYQVTVDGQSGSSVFPDSPSVPSFTVKPGQDLTVTLDVTVPPVKGVTDLSVGLIGAPSAAGGPGGPGIQAPSNDIVQPQPLSPGTHEFVLSWPGSASELTPGTVWTLFMSAGTPDSGYGGPIATVTVAP